MLVDNCLYDTHIGNTYLSMGFEVEITLHWVPVFEQTQIDNHSGGCPTHSSSTVNVNLSPQVSKFLEFTGRPVEFNLQVFCIEVVNWEVDWYDVPLFVVGTHERPVNAPVNDVNVSLDIQYRFDPCLVHGLSILLSLWIGANENVSVTDEVERKVRNKVGVCFVDATIDDKDLIDVRPELVLLFAELSCVEVRLSDVADAGRLPLPDSEALGLRVDAVLVDLSHWEVILLHNNAQLPRPDSLTC